MAREVQGFEVMPDPTPCMPILDCMTTPTPWPTGLRADEVAWLGATVGMAIGWIVLVSLIGIVVITALFAAAMMKD